MEHARTVARADGEDWLTGRPVVGDEAVEDSRRVRSPKSDARIPNGRIGPSRGVTELLVRLS
jgi:hypothetical protein